MIKMRTKVYNQKNDWVGDIDHSTKTYYTQRDSKKGQVFYHFGNAIAVDSYILKQLIQYNTEFIVVTIVNFEKESFFIITTVDFFLRNSEKINYDKRNSFGESYTGYGEQRRMPMNLWKRAYSFEELKQIKFDEQLNLEEYS